MKETFTIIGFNGELRKASHQDFLASLKTQRYGTITMFALQNTSKKEIMWEMDYESIKKLDDDISETINFVENTKNYQYGNKYHPELTTGKKQVLKKLNKLLRGE